MTQEQEAQQAQTLAELIRLTENAQRYSNGEVAPSEFYQSYKLLPNLRILIDSQAQELIDKESAMRVALAMLKERKDRIDEQEQKIAEQAKEIERLKTLIAALPSDEGY